MIASELRLFLVALQFLTRIPVPTFDSFAPEWLDRSAKFFPLVGALVGTLAAIVILATTAVLLCTGRSTDLLHDLSPLGGHIDIGGSSVPSHATRPRMTSAALVS